MARTAAKWALRLALPVPALWALVALAHLPLGEAPEEGVLRLAWRTIGARVQVCRDYTAEEKATIPAHMRREQLCVQSLLPYRLTATVDGRTLLAHTVRPAGVRDDRPLFVQEDLTLAPGEHRVSVRFEPAPPEQVDDPALAAATERAAQQATTYALERPLYIAAGRIVMVTLEERAGEFAVAGETPPPGAPR